MYQWVISAFFCSILIGCGGSSTSSVSNDGAEESVNITDIDDIIEDEVEGEDEDAVDIIVNNEVTVDDNEINDVVGIVIDYSQIKCEDTLLSVLALMNEKRAQAQVCGTTDYPAVSALEWNILLTSASQVHADNMANYDFFAHKGLDDLSVDGRVDAQGYSWNYVGENIAAGYFSAESVIDGWMNSEGHCKNMMNANFTEVGLACTVNGDSTYKTYWVQNFAKPSD